MAEVYRNDEDQEDRHDLKRFSCGRMGDCEGEVCVTVSTLVFCGTQSGAEHVVRIKANPMLEMRQLKIFLLIPPSAALEKQFGPPFRPRDFLRPFCCRNLVRHCSSKSMRTTNLEEGTSALSGTPKHREYLSDVCGVNGIAISTSDEVGSMSDRVDDRDLNTLGGVLV